MYFTAIYASCSARIHKDMFDSLMDFSQGVTIPRTIGGDLNCIITPEEKIGGVMPSAAAMLDFQSFISVVGLIDAGFSGTPYTWSNNQTGTSHIRARLDKVLYNEIWLNSSFSLSVKHSVRGPSDHVPILMNVLPMKTAPWRFIYQQMWHTHPDFMEFVKLDWDRQVQHCHPFYTL